MDRGLKLAAALAALILLTAGLACIEAPAARERALDAKAGRIVSGMSAEERIGQVLLMNFRRWGRDADGNGIAMEECSDEVKRVIADYHLGNVILFGENLQDTAKSVRLVDELQSASIDAGGLPLLIGTDQEGGIVTRLGQGACLPGSMAIGASGRTENARLAGGIIGQELHAIGINCDFAPDCDVNDNPANPVINLRSFSPDADTVARMAVAMREGLAENGVISAAKHFPGHGNTVTDTHVGLALVEKSRTEWDRVEAVPFKAMIRAGADMIMSAHIQYPGLDGTRYISKLSGEEIYLPATLSHTILTDILRGQLGFDGVIVTDAMDMQAITDNFGETEVCVMALAAGADLICNPTSVECAEDVQKLQAIYDAIIEALDTGALDGARLEDAARRVVRLKLKYGIIGAGAEPETLERRIETACATVGSAEHRVLERRLADEAVTYHCERPYEKMELSAGEKVLFLIQYENKGSSAQYAMSRLEREGVIPQAETLVYLYDGETAVSGEALELMREADKIVIVSQLSAGSVGSNTNTDAVMPRLYAKAVEELGKTGDSAVISIGLPYDADDFPGLPVYIAYGYLGMDAADAQSGVITKKYGPNLPAAIDCLMGAFAPMH